MGDSTKKWFSLNQGNSNTKPSGSCGCGNPSGGCGSHNSENTTVSTNVEERHKDGFEQVFDVRMDRRSAFKNLRPV